MVAPIDLIDFPLLSRMAGFRNRFQFLLREHVARTWFDSPLLLGADACGV